MSIWLIYGVLTHNGEETNETHRPELLQRLTDQRIYIEDNFGHGCVVLDCDGNSEIQELHNRAINEQTGGFDFPLGDGFVFDVELPD